MRHIVARDVVMLSFTLDVHAPFSCRADDPVSEDRRAPPPRGWPGIAAPRWSVAVGGVGS
jgi:hypothetical protein